MIRALDEIDRSPALRAGSVVGLAGIVAIAYFLAAQVGLALRAQPSDVAVFWPASGIAVGILILLGPRAYPALVIGVVVATVAANLLNERGLWTSLLKGFCNAGEAVLMASLLERWFGRSFTFGDFRRVAGFLGVAGLATATSAIGGAATMTLLHTNAPFWDVWLTWFLASGVGIVVVVPLVIGLSHLWREPPSRAQSVEGVGVLTLLAVIATYVQTHSGESWLSFSPNILVMPLLLWLAARCPAPFAIAGAFIVSVLVIGATTFGIGRFGDVAVPIMDRVGGAQAAAVTGTVFTLVLTMLFEERKTSEEKLRESEERQARRAVALSRLHEANSQLWLKRDLHQALDEILAGAIELLRADMGNIRVLDAKQGVLEIAAQRGFKEDFLDSFRELSAAGSSTCGRALRSRHRIVIEDVETDPSFIPFRTVARAASFRAVQSTPIMNHDGTPLGILSTHFRSPHRSVEQDLRLLDFYVRQAGDIIERHQTDDILRQSEERLRLAQLRTGVGIWDWNLRTGELTWTSQLEVMFGLEPGSVKSYADFRNRVHPDDIEAVEAGRDKAVGRRETFNLEFRIIRADGQVRWISATGGAFYDETTGEAIRVLGNNVDITERKRAEEHRNVLNAELDHRVKNVLATINAIIVQTRKDGRSLTDFVATVKDRIRSLASTHELLSHSHWNGVSLEKIIQHELAPYASCNTEISGPSITLRPAAAQATGMVIHELTTNAAKYGALSSPCGQLSVRWRWVLNGSAHSRLAIEWQEIGGPPILGSVGSGFGTKIIREVLPYELGATVDLSLAPDGARCRLEIPIDSVSGSDHSERPRPPESHPS